MIETVTLYKRADGSIFIIAENDNGDKRIVDYGKAK